MVSTFLLSLELSLNWGCSEKSQYQKRILDSSEKIMYLAEI